MNRKGHGLVELDFSELGEDEPAAISDPVDWGARLAAMGLFALGLAVGTVLTVVVYETSSGPRTPAPQPVVELAAESPPRSTSEPTAPAPPADATAGDVWEAPREREPGPEPPPTRRRERPRTERAPAPVVPRPLPAPPREEAEPRAFPLGHEPRVIHGHAEALESWLAEPENAEVFATYLGTDCSEPPCVVGLEFEPTGGADFLERARSFLERRAALGAAIVSSGYEDGGRQKFWLHVNPEPPGTAAHYQAAESVRRRVMAEVDVPFSSASADGE